MTRLSTKHLSLMKQEKKRICMLTCYDATFAKLLDKAGIDALLVGDSLGMVMKGESSTLNVSLEEMIYHTKSVARGSEKAHIIADMPFLSYQCSDDAALANAGRLIQAGAQSVKLEGGAWLAPLIKRMVRCGIPVMGHIGLLPQHLHAMGGYVVQGKNPDAKERLLQDAFILQEAGAFSIVIEGVIADVAQSITEALSIPTIGIGAGSACDGQVLVLQDFLRLQQDIKPKFVKAYASLDTVVTSACESYIQEVREGSFPAQEHSYL